MPVAFAPAASGVDPFAESICESISLQPYTNG